MGLELEILKTLEGVNLALRSTRLGLFMNDELIPIAIPSSLGIDNRVFGV